MYFTINVILCSLTELLTRHHSFEVCWMKEVDHVHTVSKKVLWIIAYYVLDTVAIEQNRNANSLCQKEHSKIHTCTRTCTCMHSLYEFFRIIRTKLFSFLVIGYTNHQKYFHSI